MSKLLKICMVVAAVLSFTGCYNDFDDPAPAKVWTEADFNKDQIITIKQLKDILCQICSGINCRTWQICRNHRGLCNPW